MFRHNLSARPKTINLKENFRLTASKQIRNVRFGTHYLYTKNKEYVYEPKTNQARQDEQNQNH